MKGEASSIKRAAIGRGAYVEACEHGAECSAALQHSRRVKTSLAAEQQQRAASVLRALL